jgi:hypothetical protein
LFLKNQEKGTAFEWELEKQNFVFKKFVGMEESGQQALEVQFWRSRRQS